MSPCECCPFCACAGCEWQGGKRSEDQSVGHGTISEAERCANTTRPLTRSTSTTAKEGLAMKATRICSVDDCDRKHEARGLCARHYQRLKVTLDFDGKTCAIDECEARAWSRGWCQAHYRRWQTHGDPLGSKPRRPRPDCSVDGCSMPNDSKGLCSTHLARLRRTGSVGDPVPVVERFDMFVGSGEPDECWEWLGPRNNSGYGRVGQLYAHRVACERAHGEPSSPDLVAMHACDNPPCVNPAHLSWGTQAQNVADSWARNRRRSA